jgi:PST family polysaccharide transporter
MFGLAVTAEPFIRIFLGTRWAPVAGLLLVFAPLGAAQSLYATVGLIYNTRGRTDLNFKWTIFASIAYVTSFVVGLRWGIMGVASCYALVWTVLMIPGFLIPLRLISLPGKALFMAIWPTLWMSLAMAFVARIGMLGLYSAGIRNVGVVFIVAVLLGICTYVGLVLWRKPPALSELVVILGGSSKPVLRRIGSFLSRASPVSEAISKVDAATLPGT